MKAERAPGEHPDLRVDRLDASVREPMLDRRDDAGALLGDGLGELDERREATSASPRDPLVEQRDRRVGGQPIDLAQLLLEQVAAVQRLVGFLDVSELRVLASVWTLAVAPPWTLEVAPPRVGCCCR